ncbi:disease resistance protein RGA2-like protein [Carex littledalei]|uniref:Disease resistance protein RGA2-like protein n=1 Tax=Carex littledalei TaxID=544730 RepID=A0A833VTC6_9POAL|nr:disease resistance protein RGA2-like protein [Carex littledalei]
MLIPDLIRNLQQPGSMLEMEEERKKMLDFFADTQSKLADAEFRAEGDPDVNTWLVDLNEVVDDADDILDDFRYATLQAEEKADSKGCQNGDRVRAGIFSCFKISSINLPFFNEWTLSNGALGGIGNRIGSVVNKIDDLVERMRVLNFQPNLVEQQLLFSSPTEIDDIFVGRDEEMEGILKLLVEAKGRPYINILGPHGIGKTALARFICNDDEINSYFECVLWVKVGSKFNIGKVAKSIIDQVIGKDCCISHRDLTLLVYCLRRELLKKMVIIVLDDVSNHHYMQLSHILDYYNCLIIATSSFPVELQCGDRKAWPLQPLMANDQWNLFCRKAFCHDACPEILEEMGQEILVRCGGSPLAVNMMGGLMRFKKGPEEWQGVINQLEKEILNDIGAITVETIIKVCYHNLCSQVKQCFAFCSLFPKSHYMDKEVLIKLWMASGLLVSNGCPPEEMGNIVFDELASRHFFENVKLVHEDSYGNKHGYRSRVTCNMLDLIHEQAVIAAREFIRKMPYQSISGNSVVDIPMLLETNPDVHILLSPDSQVDITVNCSDVRKSNSLRGLHLHSALFERDLELKHMRYLRYLNLSGSTIKTLPDSTSLLYLLQTLNLSKCLNLYQLPKNMKYMSSLRHLYIHKCPKLKKMPAHFRQLSNLQTLTTYIVGENSEKAGTGIDEIKDMQLSGLLELYNLCMVETAAIAKEANLVLKTNLDRLTLCWGSEQLIMSKGKNDLEVLEALQPHLQLKVLKIQQYGASELATWLANPVAKGPINLVELHLICCQQCKTLPALWELPSLRVLCLKHMPNLSCISRTDEKDSSELFFPSLKKLVLVGLKKLERWQEEKVKGEEEEEDDECDDDDDGGGATCSKLEATFEVVIFTVLDEMEITNCPNLKTMPRAPYLKHINVSIENYKQLQFVIDVITQAESLVEEVNIAKASDANNEPFPRLEVEEVGHVNKKLKKMRMNSTNSLFMPIALPHSLLVLWRPFQYSLQYLDICNCNTLVSWPLEFMYLRSLIRLSIRSCPNLTGVLPSEKGYVFSLSQLELYDCSSLVQVPELKGLVVFELNECPNFKSVASLWNLDMLYLSCISWTSLPSGFEHIRKLGTLWVSECYNLTSLPDELACMDCLETLIIHKCPLLKELPAETMLSSLKKLQISKCFGLEKFCNEEPYSSILSQIGKSSFNNDDSEEDKK